MKIGTLTPLLFVLSCTPLMVSVSAHAQLQTVAATFDSGESEPVGVGAPLRTSGRLNNNNESSDIGLTTGNDVATAATNTPSASTLTVDTSMPAVTAMSAAAPVVASSSPDSHGTWAIYNGERISVAFTRWARAIGWQIIWEPTDLVALANLELNDSFTGAISKVVEALNRGDENIQAKFYATNHMLRITARK